MRPMTQARMVETGSEGSSVLSTTARTSAYGLLLVMRAVSSFISQIKAPCFSGFSIMSSLAVALLVSETGMRT